MKNCGLYSNSENEIIVMMIYKGKVYYHTKMNNHYNDKLEVMSETDLEYYILEKAL